MFTKTAFFIVAHIAIVTATVAIGTAAQDAPAGSVQAAAL